MKKFKKLIALTCVAAMLIPSVAFAGEEEVPGDGASSTGDVVVENDNSQSHEYTKVVVPTIAEGTYKFTIDREGLLNTYDAEDVYDDGDHVFFSSISTAAQLNVKTVAESVSGDTTTNVTYTLVEKGKVEATDLLTGLVGKTIEEAATAYDGKYYVWTPAKDSAGKYTGYGEWITLYFKDDAGATPAITANYTNYIDIEMGTDLNADKIATATAAAGPLTGTYIWDGKFYTDGYADITAVEAATKYNVKGTETDVTEISSGLYVEVETTTTVTGQDPVITPTYVELTAENDATYVTFTPAVVNYNNNSNKVGITNLSTNPIAMTIDVTVKAPGLTFASSNSFAAPSNDAETTTANIYVALTDETNTKAVGTDGKAVGYYVLDGINPGETRFQDTTSSAQENTGSYNYYKYFNPVLLDSDESDYDSHEFYITADVDVQTDEKTNAAWKKYVADLKASEEDITPDITVVYNWVSLEDETEDILGDNPDTEETVEDDFVVGKKYADAEGNTYSVGTTDGWATYEEGITYELTEVGNFSLSTDTTKYVLKPNNTVASLDTVTAKLYVANDYARDVANNTSRAVAIADVTNKMTLSSTSGSLFLLITDLSDALTAAGKESGDYAFVITAGEDTYVMKYTYSAE